jgi:hypothetical protein
MCGGKCEKEKFLITYLTLMADIMIPDYSDQYYCTTPDTGLK